MLKKFFKNEVSKFFFTKIRIGCSLKLFELNVTISTTFSVKMISIGIDCLCPY